MKDAEMVKRVAAHPFTQGMTHEQLALLTDCAMLTHFEKGQVVMREGEMADRFYLIESGKIVLLSSVGEGAPVVVDAIGAGDLLGWSWIFPPYSWHFTAQATEDTQAIFFYGTILREYCERNHSLGYELFKRMSAVMIKRLQAAREKMLAVHAGIDKLRPPIGLPPYLEQEFDEDDETEASLTARSLKATRFT